MSNRKFTPTQLAATAGLALSCIFGTVTTAFAEASIEEGGVAKVALYEAPDILDPTFAQTYVGRIVLINMCEKLYDINAKSEIIPLLAKSLPEISEDGTTYTIDLRSDIKFNDGTEFNASAVKRTLERNLNNPRSARASSLQAIEKIKVVDSDTIKLFLSNPSAPLVSTLAGRAGMIESPAQLDKLGDDFGHHPVCVGPFKFVERPSNSKIVLKKSEVYYDKEKVNLDKVIFNVITQPSVLLQNLRAGAIDVAHNVSTTDAETIKSDPDLKLISTPSFAYQGISINVSNSNGAATKPFNTVDTTLAQHPKLRKALSLALNRKAINRIVFNGMYTPGCTPISPSSSFYPENFSCPAYDLAKAKALVAESGVSTPIETTLLISAGNAQTSRLGQVIQAMAKQAGFKIKLRPTEFTTSLTQSKAGNFETIQLGWSGRLDPDQNIAPFWLPTSALNYTGAHYPDVIKLIKAERMSTDTSERKEIFAKLINKFLQYNNIIYLYHPKFLVGTSKSLVGIKYYADQLLRLKSAGFRK